MGGEASARRSRKRGSTVCPVEPIEYRQRLPVERLITAGEFVGSLELRHLKDGVTRPYTIVNFVTSADGRTAVDGRSRGLSGAADRELHRTLRERVDAVLAGTGTIAADNYGRMLPAAERRERRLAAARAPEPLAVVVTRSGRLPLQAPLFSEPEARVVLFSPEPAPAGLRAEVSQEPLDTGSAAPLASALAALHERHQVRTVLCEGGPTLFCALLAEGLVDELFLTIAPALVGGEGPALASGPAPEQPAMLKLVSLLDSEGSLFLRYLVSPDR